MENPSGPASGGLRERKKRRTHDRIAEEALALFLERGFDAVTVAQVAKAADVAPQTVFNYFPTKEDLVYWRLEGFEARLLHAVAERPEGASVVDAFERFMLEQPGLPSEARRLERVAAINRMIDASATLRARERDVFDRAAAALADLIARETGAAAGDIRPRVAATALVGAHHALVELVRRRTAEGARGADLRREVRRQAQATLALLSAGLGALGADRRPEPGTAGTPVRT